MQFRLDYKKNKDVLTYGSTRAVDFPMPGLLIPMVIHLIIVQLIHDNTPGTSFKTLDGMVHVSVPSYWGYPTRTRLSTCNTASACTLTWTLLLLSFCKRKKET